MPFVKLDTGILNSTIWTDRDAREIFITALLMAEPRELPDTPQIAVRTLEPTGWTVPAGWYGFVPAAGPGIVRRAGVDLVNGMAALERLGGPEPESRSQAFGGRRLVRVDGGYVLLNYMAYRERDYTAAERQRRLRERRRAVTPLQSDVTPSQAVTSRMQIADSRVHTETETKTRAALTRRVDAILPTLEAWKDVEAVSERRVIVAALRNAQAELVFAYWAKIMHHENALMDRGRTSRLLKRLRENKGDVSELLYAVDGARKDPHLMGERADSDRKYDGIETIFRDRAQVERLSALAHPKGPHAMILKYPGLNGAHA